MNLLKIGTRLISLAARYPLEKRIKANYSKSELMLQELMSNPRINDITSETPPEEEAQEEIPAIQELSLEQVIKREQEGDWCISCVPGKHLFRVKDALSDALNIANREGRFTDVAESKIQAAVYNLNGAELDLEKARTPDVIKPAVLEMHTQIGRLRNFLRVDQSGLELASAAPKEALESMKKNLETAIQVTDEMIKQGYDLAKLQIRQRIPEIVEQQSQEQEE